MDVAVGAHAHVAGPNNQVVSRGVLDLSILVGGNPFVLVMPFGEEQADCPFK